MALLCTIILESFNSRIYPRSFKIFKPIKSAHEKFWFDLYWSGCSQSVRWIRNVNIRYFSHFSFLMPSQLIFVQVQFNTLIVEYYILPRSRRYWIEKIG